ncbi:MAG: nucleotidyltransferase family protein, partial [Waterburya sp.]
MNKNKGKKTSIAAVILAAGASRRMGQPKQLLPYQGQTLLSHVIKCAIASPCNPVIVVLGANTHKIEPIINHLPVEIAKNTKWNEGISSSIRCGILYIQKHFLNIDGVVFLACDQPFITTEIINKLINAYNFGNKQIIASFYQKTVGIPVLFNRNLFSELTNLNGDHGAKKIVKQYPDLVNIINFPLGKIDLDTLKNYQQL